MGATRSTGLGVTGSEPPPPTVKPFRYRESSGSRGAAPGVGVCKWVRSRTAFGGDAEGLFPQGLLFGNPFVFLWAQARLRNGFIEQCWGCWRETAVGGIGGRCVLLA